MPAISGRSIQHYKIDFISSLWQNLWSDCQQSFRSIYQVPTAHSFSDVLKYHRHNQYELCLKKKLNVLFPLNSQSIPLTTPQVGVE